METAILRFAAALRAAGLRVSPPEVADALRAAAAVEIDDRSAVRAALRGTLVKRTLDREAFDRLFDTHFSPFGSRAGDLPRAGGAELTLPPHAGEALGETLAELVRWLALAGDLELTLRVREAAREAGIDRMESLLQQGSIARAVLNALGVGAGSDEALDGMVAALRAGGMSTEQAQEWRDRVRELLDRLRATVRGHVRDEFARTDAENRRRRRRMVTASTELGAISDRDSAEMSRLVERLGRKLDSLPELRRRPAHGGALDMQRTWRTNLGSGGVPFRLRLERPRRRRPQVVALCDISNSVQSTVRFMLHFLYRLQDRFSRVRSFVFVSDVVEVTDEFVDADVHSAIDRALQPPGIAHHSATDYGRSLQRFLTLYPETVSPRTIVLILGDARGNYAPARADLLDQLRRRGRRLLWWNPESRSSWGLGDSAMPEYAPHCTQIAEVRTLAHLESAIDALVDPRAV